VLGEYGDGLERPGHGEVSDGGASAGSEEEDVARWRWPAKGEASRLGRSGRAKRSCWQTQLASSATARTNFVSAASHRRRADEKKRTTTAVIALIYRRRGRLQLRQLPNEVATETKTCHHARKW